MASEFFTDDKLGRVLIKSASRVRVSGKPDSEPISPNDRVSPNRSLARIEIPQCRNALRHASKRSVQRPSITALFWARRSRAVSRTHGAALRNKHRNRLPRSTCIVIQYNKIEVSRDD